MAPRLILVEILDWSGASNPSKSDSVCHGSEFIPLNLGANNEF